MVRATTTLNQFDDSDIRTALAHFFLEDEQEADFYTGPVFGVWTLRNSEINYEANVFPRGNYGGDSIFNFSQKRLHIVSVGDLAVKVIASVYGAPLQAFELGARISVDGFLETLDRRYNDRFFARYIPAPNGNDAIAVSSTEVKGLPPTFIPVTEGIRGNIVEMGLRAYLQFSDLA